MPLKTLLCLFFLFLSGVVAEAAAGGWHTVELQAVNSKTGRVVPLLAYLPDGTQPAPVILFSHGLGGSRYGSGFLGRYWASHGYIGCFLQHPGSDETIWKGKPAKERVKALQQAVSPENLLLRIQDVGTVLDCLEKWNVLQGNPLYARLDLSRIGMSGHSYGAHTTQYVSGEWTHGKSFQDARIKAAIIFSPSVHKQSDPVQAFKNVDIPWLLMTGTKDVVPLLGINDVSVRMGVFPALPAGDKYELVLYGGEHFAFTDAPGKVRNSAHHRIIERVSTAFWDAFLRKDKDARAWLQNSVAALLDPRDTWKFK